MHTLSLLLAGYSVFSAAALALTHFTREAYRGQALARAFGLLLLAELAALQLAHVARLQAGLPWPDSLAYRLNLYLIAPSVHLFSRSLLQPGGTGRLQVRDLAHLAALPLALVLPATSAQTLAFLIGAGYLVGLGRRLWALRAERAHFQTEALLLAATFVVALAVAVLGLLPGWVPADRFIAWYTSAVGLAFLLVQSTLNLRPQLPVVVQEAVEASVQGAYAQTTLAKVDCDAALARLCSLMAGERLYADPELSLGALAGHLGLSPHQLSELLNTRLGKTFARYVREQRVAAAKAMLIAEPGASVLSIGLSVGFATQSNFYEAFREIEGSTPGQYRKLHRANPPPPPGRATAQ